MDNKLYSQYLSVLEEQINHLKVNGFPGLFTTYAKICEEQSSLLQASIEAPEKSNHDSSNVTQKQIGEELVVKLPFAGTNFIIRVLISLHEPWVPPDLLFSDSEFMESISTEELEEFIPCLDKWNYLSDDTMSQLFSQIHHLYKRYQLKNLEEKEVLLFEYQSLLEDLDIKEEDIELSVSGGNSWLASILIKLPLSLKDVPPVLLGDSTPSSNLLHLKIKKDDGSFSPKLVLSPQVESLLDEEAEAEHLPSVPPGSSIADFVSRILSLLEGEIKFAVKCFESRKQFMADLLCHFSGSLLEYDHQTFTKASLLHEVKGFYFIVEISLPKFFPKEKPAVSLRSVYQTNTRGPISRQVAAISYNSKTTFEEIIGKIKAAILKAVPNFQNMNKGKIQFYTIE